MSVWDRIRERFERERLEEFAGFLKKHRKKLILLAVIILALLPAAYGAYIYLSNQISAGPITVGQVQSMTLSWVQPPPSTTIQYQNNTVSINVYNPNAMALSGKWVFQVNEPGIEAIWVDVYMKGPNDADFVLLTSKIVGGADVLYIESPARQFPSGTQTWSFKIKFNYATQYDSLKVYIVDAGSSP